MKLRCNKCNEIIEGDKKGTYITCKCKAIAIDETPDYYRISGNQEDFTVMDFKYNLQQYVDKDESYQRYKETHEYINDFDEFCINHCKDIVEALTTIKILEQEKRASEDLLKKMTDEKADLIKKINKILKGE